MSPRLTLSESFFLAGIFALTLALVACPVALTDIAIHPNPECPDKIKARGCCAPVYEVDYRGKPIAAKREVTQAAEAAT